VRWSCGPSQQFWNGVVEFVGKKFGS